MDNDLIAIIIVSLFCAVLSLVIYYGHDWETRRHEHREKYGIDPKYHGWEVDDTDKDK